MRQQTKAANASVNAPHPSANSEWLSSGTMNPITTLATTSETNDCTDAAEPATAGNRSSMRSVTTGKTSWMPVA